MTIIGLTGSVATGKSTVAQMMREQGAFVVDADRIVHGLMEPQTEVYGLIIAHFGAGILTENRIDRGLLADIVFADDGRTELDDLCRIIHPPVINIIKREITRLKKEGLYKLIVIDAPLLFEAGLEKEVDKVVVVKTSFCNQIERGRHVHNLNEEQMSSRINAQMPLEEKVIRADFVIDNNGTIDDTRAEVNKLLNKMLY